MRPAAKCKGCLKRCVGCHSFCESYIAYKVELHDYNQLIRKTKEARDALMEITKDREHRYDFKKRGGLL